LVILEGGKGPSLGEKKKSSYALYSNYHFVMGNFVVDYPIIANAAEILALEQISFPHENGFSTCETWHCFFWRILP
jgi:hypothetical protein